jgi:hypothetical protein
MRVSSRKSWLTRTTMRVCVVQETVRLASGPPGNLDTDDLGMTTPAFSQGSNGRSRDDSTRRAVPCSAFACACRSALQETGTSMGEPTIRYLLPPPASSSAANGRTSSRYLGMYSHARDMFASWVLFVSLDDQV